jgi:hypothetical protein
VNRLAVIFDLNAMPFAGTGFGGSGIVLPQPPSPRKT